MDRRIPHRYPTTKPKVQPTQITTTNSKQRNVNTSKTLNEHNSTSKSSLTRPIISLSDQSAQHRNRLEEFLIFNDIQFQPNGQSFEATIHMVNEDSIEARTAQLRMKQQQSQQSQHLHESFDRPATSSQQRQKWQQSDYPEINVYLNDTFAAANSQERKPTANKKLQNFLAAPQINSHTASQQQQQQHRGNNNSSRKVNPHSQTQHSPEQARFSRNLSRNNIKKQPLTTQQLQMRPNESSEGKKRQQRSKLTGNEYISGSKSVLDVDEKDTRQHQITAQFKDQSRQQVQINNQDKRLTKRTTNSATNNDSILALNNNNITNNNGNRRNSVNMSMDGKDQGKYVDGKAQQSQQQQNSQKTLKDRQKSKETEMDDYFSFASQVNSMFDKNKNSNEIKLALNKPAAAAGSAGAAPNGSTQLLDDKMLTSSVLAEVDDSPQRSSTMNMKKLSSYELVHYYRFLTEKAKSDIFQKRTLTKHSNKEIS